MDDLKIEIERLIKELDFNKAVDLLSVNIEENPESIELLELRGDVYQLMQKFGNALNDFNKVIKIDKHNKDVIAKVEMVQQILKFQNLDIFESTNLNLDPWLD